MRKKPANPNLQNHKKLDKQPSFKQKIKKMCLLWEIIPLQESNNKKIIKWQ